MKKLESVIAFREGKKSKAKIGDIREVIKHLKDIFAEESVDYRSNPKVFCVGPQMKKFWDDIYSRTMKLKAKRRKRVEQAVKRFAK